MKVPVAYALAACFFVFACASFGALTFHKLVSQRSPAFKLVPVEPLMGARLDNGVVKGIKLGILLNNSGMFPIEFRATELRSIVDGRVRTVAQTPFSQGAILYPNTPNAYWDSEVELTVDQDRLIECTLDIRLSYGKPGRLVNHLDGRYKIFSKLAPGQLGKVEWFHA